MNHNTDPNCENQLFKKHGEAHLRFAICDLQLKGRLAKNPNLKNPMTLENSSVAPPCS
jgi:hypothetical protein